MIQPRAAAAKLSRVTTAAHGSAGAVKGQSVCVTPGLLTQTQRNVLAETNRRAKALSARAEPALFRRLIIAGYSEREVKRLLRLVRQEAQITVTFDPTQRFRNGSVLDALLSDDRLRNQFETRVSTGHRSAQLGGRRELWEREIFNNGYPANPLLPSERPRYAALNLYSRSDGGSARHGPCYFILANTVRKRSTITPVDSALAQLRQVGTFSHCAHTLLACRWARLKSFLALDEAPRFEPLPWEYLEVQVHGSILLGSDVTSLVANVQLRRTPWEQKLKRLADKWKLGFGSYDAERVWFEREGKP